jgi:hypothetical protein
MLDGYTKESGESGDRQQIAAPSSPLTHLMSAQGNCSRLNAACPQNCQNWSFLEFIDLRKTFGTERYDQKQGTKNDSVLHRKFPIAKQNKMIETGRNYETRSRDQLTSRSRNRSVLVTLK